jgi:hypothetical protein
MDENVFSRRTIVLAALILFLGILTGCNLPGPELPPDLPECSPYDGPAAAIPQLLSPEEGALVDAPPTLQWEDDGPCTPMVYEVVAIIRQQTMIREQVDYPDQSLTLTDYEFLPGAIVDWRVNSLWVGENEETILLAQSEQQRFYIGPACASDELLAPELIEPEDGAEVSPYASPFVSSGLSRFRWFEPAYCLPDGYHLQVAQDENFQGDLAIDLEFQEPVLRYDRQETLERATTYYWRVAGMVDGQQGPWSGVWSFTTLDEDPPLPFSLFTGVLWAETCDNPMPRDDIPAGYQPPEGCQIVDGQVVADGIRQEDEPGIAGVGYRVQPGPCEASPPDTQPSKYTEEDGVLWEYVSLGVNCVWIDSTLPSNFAILGNGIFSTPNVGTTASFEVTIEQASTVVQGVDFGWDPDGELIEGNTSVGGRVWIDVDSDGEIDVSETGIGQVDMQLYRGTCGPDSEVEYIGHMPSDDDGTYGYLSQSESNNDFMYLPPGDYCLELGYLGGDMPFIFEEGPLGYGEWTTPSGLILVNEEMGFPARMNFTLTGQQSQMRLDFGYHHLPFMIVNQSAVCRYGPATNYRALHYYEQGDTRWLEGRVSNNTWWRADPEGCWIAASLTDFFGDPHDLPLLPIPPSPVPPTEEPSDQVAPLVEINHSPGDPTEIDQVTFHAMAGDDVGVTRIRIYVGVGSATPTVVKTCNNTETCNYTGGPYPAGEVHYYATADDAAGNHGTSMPHVVDIDHYYQ